jgi:cytochrome bd-type quinol oxidase subunit 1
MKKMISKEIPIFFTYEIDISNPVPWKIKLRFTSLNPQLQSSIQKHNLTLSLLGISSKSNEKETLVLVLFIFRLVAVTLSFFLLLPHYTLYFDLPNRKFQNLPNSND